MLYYISIELFMIYSLYFVSCNLFVGGIIKKMILYLQIKWYFEKNI